MGRVPKNNINTPFLHIMIQGNNKDYIFKFKEDVEKYLNILKKTKENINVVIIAYCVMGNHVHLLFYSKNIGDLIRFMHDTNLIYARYYNKKYDRVGYVFRDRYKTQPINSERHLINCIDYIHNNPVKAQICNNASNYPYSSYNRNIFKSNDDIELRIRKYIDSKKTQYLNDTNNDFVLLEDVDNSIDKEELGNRLVNDYLKSNNISKEKLKNDKQLLVKIAKRLKDKYDISYRISSKILGIGRETLRNLISKFND